MAKQIRSKNTHQVSFPSQIVAPVSEFLKTQLTELEKRKKKIAKDDPFRDTARVDDNAAPDVEADEQFGHARVSAIKEQIDRRMIQTKRALARIKIGKYGICENCGKMIDTDRLMAYPEATRCISCEKNK